MRLIGSSGSGAKNSRCIQFSVLGVPRAESTSTANGQVMTYSPDLEPGQAVEVNGRVLSLVSKDDGYYVADVVVVPPDPPTVALAKDAVYRLVHPRQPRRRKVIEDVDIPAGEAGVLMFHAAARATYDAALKKAHAG